MSLMRCNILTHCLLHIFAFLPDSLSATSNHLTSPRWSRTAFNNIRRSSVVHNLRSSCPDEAPSAILRFLRDLRGAVLARALAFGAPLTLDFFFIQAVLVTASLAENICVATVAIEVEGVICGVVFPLDFHIRCARVDDCVGRWGFLFDEDILVSRDLIVLHVPWF